MKALLNGTVMSAEDALTIQRAWMQRRGITRPRVKIGVLYQPDRRPLIQGDAEAIQSALLKEASNVQRRSSVA